jgi:hypothetical protein
MEFEVLPFSASASFNPALGPLSRSVIPMFKVGDVGQPEAFGSAVLIELEGQQFLATARHVVDEHMESRISSPNGPHKLAPKAKRSSR